MALELRVGRPDRLREAAAGEVVTHQVRDDLGVGLRGEDGANVGQALLERHVVLDDAVDDDVDATFVVEVGVSVRLVDAPVCRPTGVADAGGGRPRRHGDATVGAVPGHRHRLAKPLQVADGADGVDRVARDEGDAG